MDDQELDLDLYFKNRLELELKDPLFLTKQLMISEKQILELKQINAEMLPKVELHDKIVRLEDQVSITEISRIFKLRARMETIPWLEAQHYVFRENNNLVASTKAISEGILGNKVYTNDYGYVTTQAVVEPSMFPKWNSNVVPNIKRWVEKCKK